MKRMRIIVTILYMAIIFASSFHIHALYLGGHESYKATPEKVNVIFHINDECVLSQFRSIANNYLSTTVFEFQVIESQLGIFTPKKQEHKNLSIVTPSLRAPPIPA